MMVGSVRGKARLLRVVRVRQGSRVYFAAAGEASVGGQTRLVPDWTERVGRPQPPQKGLRAFQSRMARDWAYIAAGGVRISGDGGRGLGVERRQERHIYLRERGMTCALFLGGR